MFAVAPSAGAWIEINESCVVIDGKTSLPPRERGLKSLVPEGKDLGAFGRSLRGSVD